VIAPTGAAGSARDARALELYGLTKRFGRITAVDRLSLTVERGVAAGLLGVNGAGKTTTIAMILGLLLPTAGRAIVFGEDVASHRIWAARISRAHRRFGAPPFGPDH
jgi:ABC-2 type transport system ATP-binding protein